MKIHKYLNPSYQTYEPRAFVRECLIDAFDAVADHVDRLEKRLAELEKSAQRRNDRVR